MVGASKILTVSYGTFSCTLEGFDDPFNTMRGIAEYFRDLAADDRYFGAEPPTPDAEMLHRIAEREVKRRVEARVGDDGIVLRQVEHKEGSASAAPAAAAASAAAAYAEDDEADDEPRENMFADIGVDETGEAEDADDEAEAAVAASVSAYGDAEAVETAPPAFDENSVAAKLSRIRAVVTRDRDAKGAMPFSGAIETAFQDLNAEPGQTPPAEPLSADEPAAAEPAVDVPAEDAYTDAPMAEEAGDWQPVVEPVAQDDADQGHPAFEDRTDVPEYDAEPAHETMAEDDTPEADLEAREDQPAPAAEDPLAAAEADMAAATESEDMADLAALDMTTGAPEADREPDEVEAAQAPAEETVDEGPWATPAADYLQDSDEAAAFDGTTDAGSAEVGPAPEEAPAAAPAEGLAARILRLKQAALSGTARAPEAEAQELHDDLDEDEDEGASIFAAAPHGEVDETEENAAFAGDELNAFAEPSAAAEEPAAEETAPLEETASAPRSEEVDEDDLDIDLDEVLGHRMPPPDEATDDAPREPAMLESAPAPALDDEDGLAAMRAAIAQASDAADAYSADEATGEDAAAPEDTVPESAPRHGAAAFGEDKAGDAAFDRILEQTNARMDDSDSDRRRSAIAHLKAAVAATKADRLLKRIKKPEEAAREEQSQYRDDLAKVVRPNRPLTQPRAEPHERPKPPETGGSPLMLVSALRVDGDGAAETSAIAPRRVTSEWISADEAEHHRDFAEFAEKMGATELPDLLEAAAAYSAFVEGQREFSRPQLMRRVAGFAHEDYSREAGLRSFGQLLRQGKIQKLKRGQFTITSETRFNPEARIAGE